MNISHTNVDSVSAVIQINVAKADYQEKVEKALKNFRKKANVPGFRPGTVPTGMVKKMYGKSILAEEVNELVGESLYKYIQENKLDVLGQPLPNLEKQQSLDFSTEGDYEFFFDVALAPEIKISLSKKDKLPYYNIKVTEELIERQIDSYKANYGKYEAVEEDAKETDLLKGKITELDNGKPKANGIEIESGVVMASYIKDAEEQAKFVGAKKGAVIVFNPGKAYEGNETEIASLLQIKKEETAAIAPEFSFEVIEITRYKEADLNTELFDKIFGEGNIKTADEFRTKVKESLAQQFTPDSDYKFLIDAREVLQKKAGNLQFADSILKRWLIASNKERSLDSLDSDYPRIIEDLKYQLTKEYLVKENDLKIEDNDVKKIAMDAARAQFAQYGMMGLPDSMIENYANDMLKNEESARNLVDRAMENKLIEFLKEKVSLDEKNISLDEFRKFFEKENTAEAEA